MWIRMGKYQLNPRFENLDSGQLGPLESSQVGQVTPGLHKPCKEALHSGTRLSRNGAQLSLEGGLDQLELGLVELR